VRAAHPLSIAAAAPRGLCALFAAGALVLGWLLPAAAAHADGAADVRTVALPGDEGWDYLTYDAPSARLFVAHGSRVLVIDTRELKVAGEIPDTPGVHGIALAPELGRGYVSAGRANLIVVFDLKTLARLGQVATGENPDNILYDPVTRRVFAFNGRGRSLTAVDAQTLRVAGSLALDAKPEAAVGDAAGHVYVNLEDRNAIAQLDPRTLKITARWQVPGCEAPTGLALDVRQHWLTTVCGNRQLVVLDAHSGRVLGHAAIGAGVDGVVVDHQVVLASCGEGVLSLLRLNERGVPELGESIATQRGARTLAFDAANRRVFLPTADFGPAPADARAPQLPGTFRLVVVQLPTARAAQ
jgi:hypothetical protein